MSTHSSVTEETKMPPVSATPEPSRRYIQWKEEDIGLLLKDLEQPGHYVKWKENKSGYSKRVGEQIFKNNMGHEAIKFKVRWLESRFKKWNEQLTAPGVEGNQDLTNKIREKMFKEFPYYDRCKPIFSPSSSTDFSVAQQDSAPAEHVEVEEGASEGRRSTLLDNNKRSVGGNAPESSQKKKRSNQQSLARPIAVYQPPPFLQPLNNPHAPSVPVDSRVKSMEVELELKKMDHQERMQQMKLEQLKLEIELQKLKRDASSEQVSPTTTMNTSE